MCGFWRGFLKPHFFLYGQREIRFFTDDIFHKVFQPFFTRFSQHFSNVFHSAFHNAFHNVFHTFFTACFSHCFSHRFSHVFHGVFFTLFFKCFFTQLSAIFHNICARNRVHGSSFMLLSELVHTVFLNIFSVHASMRFSQQCSPQPSHF